MEQRPDENQTRRGIEGVAQHFLSGMTSRPAATQRQGPQTNASSTFETPISTTESRPLTRMIVFGDHLEQSTKKVHHFVQQMVIEEGPMALLDLTDAATIQLCKFKAGKVSECELELLGESIDTAWQELFGSNEGHSNSQEKTAEEFVREFNALPEKVETVILHQSRRLDEKSQQLLCGGSQIVILCDCQQEQLLKTYQLIKRLISINANVLPSLFFFGQKEEEEAVGVYEKLAETCREFLDCQIEWAGCEQPIQASERQLIATDRTDATTETIYKFFAQRKITSQEHVTAPSEKPITSQPVEVRKPLVVDVLPTDDEALAKVLAGQLGWWKNGGEIAALELPLPDEFGKRASILTNGAGMVYVLMAGLGETEEMLSQAMLVRGWMMKNMRLIQGYCRDTIGDLSEIGVVLVGNSPVERLLGVQEQLDFIFLVKQVYLLEAEAFKGILVV